MEYRRLGTRGPVVSVLGFGCWAIGGHGYGPVRDETSIAAIRRAVELGVTLFDTADVYGFGHSEEILARALEGSRDQVCVATKFGVAWDASGRTHRDASPAYARRAVEASLRRLRTDCIDLYQVHWPDGRTPLADTIAELDRLREAGMIRDIGVSNFSAAAVAAAGSADRIVSAQLKFSLLDTAGCADLASFSDQGIGCLVYGVLERGLLSGKLPADARFPTGDTRGSDPAFAPAARARIAPLAASLTRVAERQGRSAAQAAIRWTVDQAGVTVALVGAKTAAQVEENADALDLRLADAERAAIAALAATINEGAACR